MKLSYEHLYDKITCYLMPVWCVFNVLVNLFLKMATSCLQMASWGELVSLLWGTMIREIILPQHMH